jgi:hypothetical protein
MGPSPPPDALPRPQADEGRTPAGRRTDARPIVRGPPPFRPSFKLPPCRCCNIIRLLTDRLEDLRLAPKRHGDAARPRFGPAFGSPFATGRARGGKGFPPPPGQARRLPPSSASKAGSEKLGRRSSRVAPGLFESGFFCRDVADAGSLTVF